MRLRLFALLFILGSCIGILFGLHKAKASTPAGEASGGEQPAGVYYDEHWKATQALVSKETGYALEDISSNQNTDKAGELEQYSNEVWYIKLFPKMVVTKWKVHGHIHFE